MRKEANRLAATKQGRRAVLAFMAATSLIVGFLCFSDKDDAVAHPAGPFVMATVLDANDQPYNDELTLEAWALDQEFSLDEQACAIDGEPSSAIDLGELSSDLDLDQLSEPTFSEAFGDFPVHFGGPYSPGPWIARVVATNEDPKVSAWFPVYSVGKGIGCFSPNGDLELGTATLPDPMDGQADTLDEYIEDVGDTFLENQKRLGDLKTWIISQPDFETSGYVEQVNDAETLSTVFLWRGQDSLRSRVGSEAASRGIQFSFEERSVSAQDIRRDIELLAEQSDELLSMGFTMTGIVGITEDYDGIPVEGVFDVRPDLLPVTALEDDTGGADPPLASSTPKSQLGQHSAARASSGAHASKPDVETFVQSVVEESAIRVEIVPDQPSPAYTRSKDITPFFAGGLMMDCWGIQCPFIQYYCSSGFAVKYDGRTWATTARHCGRTWTAADGSASYGSPQYVIPVTGLYMLAGKGAGRMFDGAWNNSSGYNKPVSGYQDVSLGDGVCTSGGMSGVHCNLKVDQMSYWWNDGQGSIQTIRATHTTAGAVAVAGGDSGGPVLVPYTGGDVKAVGMIQAMTSPVSCPAYSTHNVTTCGRSVYFTSSRVVEMFYPFVTLVKG